MIFYLYDCLYDDVDLIIGEASIKKDTRNIL